MRFPDNVSAAGRKFIDAAKRGEIQGVKAPKETEIKDKHGNYIMPFGDHKGEEITEIETQYLKWVLRDCVNINPELYAAIENEVWSRYDRD